MTSSIMSSHSNPHHLCHCTVGGGEEDEIPPAEEEESPPPEEEKKKKKKEDVFKGKEPRDQKTKIY